MNRPGPRIMFTFAALAIAAAVTLLFRAFGVDVDELEERTGVFDRIGTWIINGGLFVAACLGAFAAVAMFFPKRWGRMSIGGGLFGAFIALWFFYVLWQGGV